MSKLLFKPPGASNPSFHTRTDSTDYGYPKSFIKLISGTAIILKLGKRNENFVTGKWNLSTSFETWYIFCYCIFCRRRRALFGQYRESRLLGSSNSNTRSQRLTDLSSPCPCSESSLRNWSDWLSTKQILGACSKYRTRPAPGQRFHSGQMSAHA